MDACKSGEYSKFILLDDRRGQLKSSVDLTIFQGRSLPAVSSIHRAAPEDFDSAKPSIKREAELAKGRMAREQNVNILGVKHLPYFA